MNTNNKKYKIDYNSFKEIKINNEYIKVYRIIALKDFSYIKQGEYGGFVEVYNNLSQKGDCWIYDNAVVCQNAIVQNNATVRNRARVHGSAIIRDNALIAEKARVYARATIELDATVGDASQVYDYAIISGRAIVSNKAKVFGSAYVSNNVNIYHKAQVYGRSRILDDVVVCDNAKVYGQSEITGCTKVCGHSVIKDYAIVKGDTRVCKRAIISQCQQVSSGVVVCNLASDIKESIRCQTGLGVFDNKVIAYKQVCKDLTSFYDSDFQYTIGEVVEVENPDISEQSCASGLHFSNMNYWNKAENVLKSTFLIAEINLEDIITVQEGKIRCKKAKILGKYDI